jgi:hypothetical protein
VFPDPGKGQKKHDRELWLRARQEYAGDVDFVTIGRIPSGIDTNDNGIDFRLCSPTVGSANSTAARIGGAGGQLLPVAVATGGG